ncbi:thymidine kinase [Peptoanaerobacter stomatis]|uniref:Thymidine kinase n=1 Tax=Peptoanaerobacter stomatis TaxID=796937 RepID=J6HF82_9FIRM|nr:thymidine kinase [Peptoanaerobacter stomatis]EJU21413.1 thymidine kinase [Peptoanaerobacter stomatis]NWO24788.1 thymidine kinase [Peptostreptococcaceae bacterium oral taxon 081]
MGKLIFRYGTMNSGKSLNLLGVNYNYTQNNKNVFILKPAIDTRDIGIIKTRLSDDLSVLATLVHKDDNITDMVLKKEKEDNKKIDVILVDESQFLTKHHAKQLSILAYKHDKLVMCYGLKIDFLGNPFEGSAHLIAHSSNLEEIKTICEMCGDRKAIFHLLYIDGKLLTNAESGTVIETDDTKYMQVCGKCYNKALKDAENQ